MLLIGSQALKIKHPDFDFEKNRLLDYDFVCTFTEYKDFVNNNKNKIKNCDLRNEHKIIVFFKSGCICEFEIVWNDSSIKQIIDKADFLFDKQTINTQDFLLENIFISSIEFLYILKMSHRFLKNSKHFNKTMNDIIKLRKIIDIKEINNTLFDFKGSFFREREKETYSYNHPKLNTTKNDFFKDDIPYVYDHDSIHLAVKHLDKPAYEYYKSDEKEVFCSRIMFFDQEEKIRLFGVLEEAYVLALERSQIHKPSWTPRQSFEFALMKICTSITSGWFREYAWENYFKILNMYDDSYVEKFWKKVEEGLVLKYAK